MPARTLAASTQTHELLQITEINDRLASLGSVIGGSPTIVADQVGLAGATITPQVIDRSEDPGLPRQERRSEPLVLAAGAPLRSLLAKGDPRFPYIYAIFGEPHGSGRLPVEVHSAHLYRISGLLGLSRHTWGG
jgi:hypothetical protein